MPSVLSLTSKRSLYCAREEAEGLSFLLSVHIRDSERVFTRRTLQIRYSVKRFIDEILQTVGGDDSVQIQAPKLSWSVLLIRQNVLLAVLAAYRKKSRIPSSGLSESVSF